MSITKTGDGDNEENHITKSTSESNVEENESGNFLKTAIAGSLTGSIVVAIGQPLDVLKVRFQLQVEPTEKGAKYKSIFQAARTIVREEGVRALWSGHIPSQCLSIMHGFLQFSMFDWMSDYERKYLEGQSFGSNFVKGSIAAGTAVAASYPFDVVRTRLIAEMKTKRAYKGVTDVFVKIIKHEGPSALYKGLTPTLMQIPPHAGVQFSVYKWFSGNVFNKIKFLRRNDSDSETALLGNLLSGSIAGLTSKGITYPFDLVKRRLQIQGFQKHREDFGKQIHCQGIIDCVRLTISKEGFLALYKGYTLSIIKAMLLSALHFGIYYEIKYFVISRP